MAKPMILGLGASIVLSAGFLLLTGCDDGTAPSDLREPTVRGVCLSQPLAVQFSPDHLCLLPDEIEELKQSKVLRPESDRVAFLTLTNPADENSSVTLSTCREYDILVTDGWYPMTSLDMATEGIYVQTCDVLSALETARPAEASNLPSLGILFDDLSRLPVSLLPSFDPAEEEIGAQSKQTTIANAQKAGELDVGERGAMFLVVSTRSATIKLQEIARGDFTEDGLEDVLVSLSARVVGGTAQMTQLGIVESPVRSDLFHFHIR